MGLKKLFILCDKRLKDDNQLQQVIDSISTPLFFPLEVEQFLCIHHTLN